MGGEKGMYSLWFVLTSGMTLDISGHLQIWHNANIEKWPKCQLILAQPGTGFEGAKLTQNLIPFRQE